MLGIYENSDIADDVKKLAHTHSSEHIHLLRSPGKDGPVLLKTLLNHVAPRACAIADGSHLDFHLLNQTRQ